jgi:predicted house-cleaning noncanonical NTP pyrophosphatase (MazG superfamily)
MMRGHRHVPHAGPRRTISMSTSPTRGYRRLLRVKLTEAVEGLLAADNVDAPGERADAIEVVLAIAADLGLDLIQLEKLREAKAAGRRRSVRVRWPRCGIAATLRRSPSARTR